jgi:hypothetical protein
MRQIFVVMAGEPTRCLHLHFANGIHGCALRGRDENLFNMTEGGKRRRHE